MNRHDPIRPEEYLEPSCPFCTDFYKPAEETVTPVDLRRMTEKLDEHLARNDTAAALRHLDYWRAEAIQGRDRRGELGIENERMGLLRKLGRKDEALESVGRALALTDALAMQGTLTDATTRLNCATVYKTFGRSDLALALYAQARAVYERELAPDDPRLGGLYNNLGLALTDLDRFDEARAVYDKALGIMALAPNGALEAAITELNLADLAAKAQGLLQAEDEIERRLDRAEALLRQPELPRNGYYAFVCDKCASVFDYYGRFLTAMELRQTAEDLYAGNGAGKKLL